jgi:hypothetical protein
VNGRPDLPRRETLAYIAAQILGAIAAAVRLLAAWPSQPAKLGTTLPSVGTGSALVCEAVLTAFRRLDEPGALDWPRPRFRRAARPLDHPA